MPRKNIIKNYLENSYYHIYNRGVDKREIFLEKKDCIFFQHLLKLYLSPPEFLKNEKEMTPRLLYQITNLNLFEDVDLISFALMPNHFHLQIKQAIPDGIEKLTRRVLSSYSRYFNLKYKRQGPLFESSYKAILVKTDEQFLYLTSYIHRNPMKLVSSKFDFVEFSSFPYYLGEKKAVWIKPQEVLDYFSRTNSINKSDVLSYENFVLDFRENPEELLGDIILEDNH